MKKLITVALAGVMVLNLAACGGSGTTEQTTAASSDSTKTEAAETQSGLTETRTFKLATDQAVDYPNTIALQSFADEVKEKTDGRIDIEIYPSAQLKMLIYSSSSLARLILQNLRLHHWLSFVQI